jgi:hypothetical protein
MKTITFYEYDGNPGHGGDTALFIDDIISDDEDKQRVLDEYKVGITIPKKSGWYFHLNLEAHIDKNIWKRKSDMSRMELIEYHSKHREELKYDFSPITESEHDPAYGRVYENEDGDTLVFIYASNY